MIEEALQLILVTAPSWESMQGELSHYERAPAFGFKPLSKKLEFILLDPEKKSILIQHPHEI